MKSKNIQNKKKTGENVTKADKAIQKYFHDNSELLSLFDELAQRIVECDPDLKFRQQDGIIGFARPEERYTVYFIQAEDGFEIRFINCDKKIPFSHENSKEYLSLCEDSVIYAQKLRECDDEEEISDCPLNRSQKKFCSRPSDNNIRLIAPAGSGKTFSLLWRCKHIVDDYKKKGKNAPYFLLLTFTKSACEELDYRIKYNPEFSGIRATVRTLNSWGWEQITSAGRKLARTKSDRNSLVLNDLAAVYEKDQAIKKALNQPHLKFDNAQNIITLIDTYKSLGFEHTMTKLEFDEHYKYLKNLGIGQIIAETEKVICDIYGVDSQKKKDSYKAVSDFWSFWKKAVVRLEENKRYTMEDQKYWANEYIKNRIAEKKYPQGITKYTHIMIDEFQDINPLDLELIKTISRFHGKGKDISLTIVGDDDQSIFGWRGTTPKYIIEPEKYIGRTFVTCLLDTNYRSPKNIVELSQKLIVSNKERVEKQVKSAAKGRATIKLVKKPKYAAVTDATIALLHTLIDEKGCNQVAVIGRRQASIFPYQILLSAEGTKYNVEADIDILNGEAMKSLLEIIKIIYRAKDYDNDDPISEFIEVCDKVPGYPIAKAAKDDLFNYLNENAAETFDDALALLKKYEQNIKGTSPEILYTAIKSLYESKNVYQFMNRILENFSGLSKNYKKADIDNHYKEPQFFRLAEIAKKYDSDFRRFYRDLSKAQKISEQSRLSNTDDNGNVYLESSEIPVHLLTATRSKGHEFDAVIIVDANDKEWPHHLSENLEEERRLFYVAMTRAKKYLYFVTSDDMGVSRFINELGINL